MKIKNIAFYVVCLLSLTQCLTEKKEIILLEEDNDPTVTDINEWIEQFPVSNPSLDELILPNGESISDFEKYYALKYKGSRMNADAYLNPEDQKAMLISSMGKVAQRLCDRSKFKKTKQEGPDAPAQNWLAYSYGQDNYKERLYPATPDKNCLPQIRCPYRIQGLDCSGFITVLLREAVDPASESLLFSQIKKEHSSTLGSESYWNDIILAQNKKFSSIFLKKKGKLDAGQLQAGDIIYFTQGHIGFVLLDSTRVLHVFQSNGASNDVKCDSANYKKGQCEENYNNEKRGVRAFPATQKQINAFKGKGTYEILRFTTKLQGKWDINVKCDWANDDNVAISFKDVDFPDSQDNQSFTTKIVEGQDYDGKKLYGQIKGTYNAFTKELNAEIFITFDDDPFVRIDSFKIILPDSDASTSWQNMTSIQKEENTCIGMIKLGRSSSQSGGRKKQLLTKQNFL